jgi:hypothetical protein
MLIRKSPDISKTQPRKVNMAQEAKQNELRNEGKSRIGSINHLIS